MTTPQLNKAQWNDNQTCNYCTATTQKECIELYRSQECEKYNHTPCEICGLTDCTTNHWTTGEITE